MYFLHYLHLSFNISSKFYLCNFRTVALKTVSLLQRVPHAAVRPLHQHGLDCRQVGDCCGWFLYPIHVDLDWRLSMVSLFTYHFSFDFIIACISFNIDCVRVSLLQSVTHRVLGRSFNKMFSDLPVSEYITWHGKCILSELLVWFIWIFLFDIQE